MGGEEVGGWLGEVELEDGGVLEEEFGLGRAEDEVDDEDDDEDDDDEEDEEGAEVAEEDLSLVVAAVLGHGCCLTMVDDG